MDSIPEAMLVRAVVRWRCTATSNVDAPQGVVRLVQAHSLGAYWQTWPHVAARRSCFGAAAGVELPAPVPLALLCASCALVRQCRCGCSRSGCRRRRGAKRGAPKRGALQRQRRCHARLPPSAVMPEWLGVRVGAGVCVEQRGHFSTLVHQQFARDEGFASVGPCEPTSLTRSSSVDSGGAGP